MKIKVDHKEHQIFYSRFGSIAVRTDVEDLYSALILGDSPIDIIMHETAKDAKACHAALCDILSDHEYGICPDNVIRT